MKPKSYLAVLSFFLCFVAATPSRADDGYYLDLGHLDQPGLVLGGTTQYVFSGGVVTFTTIENANQGLGSVSVDNPDLLTVEREIISADLTTGDRLVRYTITISFLAGIGESARVFTTGVHPERRDPVWSFEFEVMAIDA